MASVSSEWQLTRDWLGLLTLAAMLALMAFASCLPVGGISTLDAVNAADAEP